MSRWSPAWMDQTVRFQDSLRRLAMIDESFVRDEVGFGLSPDGTSALDPKAAALLQVAASVALGSSSVCVGWSVSRAMAAGADEDEIADVMLAIAPVVGLGRVAAAAVDVAAALGYDVPTAWEEPDGTDGPLRVGPSNRSSPLRDEVVTRHVDSNEARPR